MRSRHQHPTRSMRRALASIVACGIASTAEARVEQLVWEHPTPNEVSGFKIHHGESSGSYDQVVDVGLPTRAPDGSFSYELTVADDAPLFVAISAYDADRTSPLSNERVRDAFVVEDPDPTTDPDPTPDPDPTSDPDPITDPDPGPSADPDPTSDPAPTPGGGGSGGGGLDLPIGEDPNTVWFEDFQASALGAFVPDWLDTAAGNSMNEQDDLFAVVTLPDDNRVLETRSTQSDIHSHFVGMESGTWGAYELMALVRVDDANARIGVTSHSRYPNEDSYYAVLTSWRTGEFEIHGHPNPWLDNGAISCPVKTTGVIVEADVWYRIRFRVEPGDNETSLQAKVWPSETTEPTDWQARCVHTNADLPFSGTVGVWSGRAGGKQWDNFEVISEPTASDDAPIPPPAPPILLPGVSAR